MTTPDFDLGDDLDEEDQDQGTGQESGPMNAVRKELRQARKELKAEREARATAEASLQEYAIKERQQAVVTVAREVGLSEKHAALLLKAKPDLELTKDAIYAAAVEEELLVPAETEEPAPAAIGVPFVPITAGGTPPSSKMDREQWVALQTTDPDAAMRAFAEGRVEGLEKLNPAL